MKLQKTFSELEKKVLNLSKANEDLRTYQIELENQNELLKAAHKKSTVLQDRYFKLYEFAPLAYLILDNKGSISEANLVALNMLDLEKRRFKNMEFSSFICPEFQDTFSFHCEQVIETQMTQTCDLQLVREDKSSFWASLDSKAIFDDKGEFFQLNIEIVDITRRKQLEVTLLESEKKYKSLIHNIPGMIYIGNPDWSTDIIAHSEGICGYSIEEFNTQSVNWINIIHPDDKERVLQEVSEIVKKPLSIVQEYRIIDKDGRARWIEDHKSSHFTEEGIFRGVDGIVLDVDLRKMAEEETQELISLIEHSSDFIGLSTLDGNITFVNQAGLAMVGLDSLDEAKKTKIVDFAPDKIKTSLIEKALPMLRDNRRWTGETRFINFKTGDTFPMEINAYLITRPLFKNSVIALVGRDLSEQRTLEKLLHQAQKMESLGTLAGGIVHDFSTLLGIITGYADIIKKEIPKDSVIQNDLDSITKVTGQAANLIKQIKDFSQPKSIDKRPVNIISTLRDALKLVRTLLPSTILIHEESEVEELMANVNEDQIKQVLINLCSNAADFMKGDHQILKIRIEVAGLNDGLKLIHRVGPVKYMKLSISDTGSGIDPKIIDRVFDPYFTTKEVGKGSGLGLSIVYNIVQNHNGYIFAESTLEGGATFIIYLPLVEANLNGTD